MVFSLVIILGGALVLAGWAQMMATRATDTTMSVEAQKSRIAMANGRALARQYVLNHLPFANSFVGTNYSLANGWGGFVLQVPPDNPWTTTNLASGNPFNPISGDAFVVSTPCSIINDDETNTWTFLLRGLNPLLAGYPLVIHNPASATAANLAWVPAATARISWNDEIRFSHAPDIPFTSGSKDAGPGTNGYIGYFASPISTNYNYVTASVTYPTNTFSVNTAVFVPPAQTNGNTVTRYFNGGFVGASIGSNQPGTIVRYDVPSSITNMFTFTSLVTNPYTATNTNISTVTNVLINGTNYRTNNNTHKVTTNYTYVTNYTYTTNYVTVTNYATNTYIDNYTNSSPTNLTIAASTDVNTLHIVVPSANSNLSSITLSGATSSRRIYIDHSGGGLTLQTATTNENYNWWLGMTVVGFNSSFTVLAPTGNRTLTLQGGIRTDRNIALNRGNLALTSSSVPAISGTNPAPVEYVGDRILWLEDQRAP